MGCENENNPTKKDKYGKGCGDYAKAPENYCGLPARDSATFSYTDCCACKPKSHTTSVTEIHPILLSDNLLSAIITGSIVVGVAFIAIIVAAVAVHCRLKVKVENAEKIEGKKDENKKLFKKNGKKEYQNEPRPTIDYSLSSPVDTDESS